MPWRISFGAFPSFSPGVFEFDGCPRELGSRSPRSFPSVMIFLPPDGCRELKKVYIKDAVVIFVSPRPRGQQELGLSPPCDADVVLDLRAYTATDRGLLEQGWRQMDLNLTFVSLQSRVVPSSMRVEMGDEEEKAAMERMFVKLGWTAREKAIVVRAPDP